MMPEKPGSGKHLLGAGARGRRGNIATRLVCGMPAFMPPFAGRETVDRPDRGAATEVRDPGLLDGILPCRTGHLARFGEETFRLTDWRQCACHLPCTDALRRFLAGEVGGIVELLHR
jgi:hypothetical protein